VASHGHEVDSRASSRNKRELMESNREKREIREGRGRELMEGERRRSSEYGGGT